MDKNQDGNISVHEFINCYAQGEIKLKEKLNEVIKAMAERRRQMDEFQERLENAKETEVLNKFGIKENSTLTVHVMQAEDLRANESEGGSLPELHVIVSIENQKIETKPASNSIQQPVWD